MSDAASNASVDLAAQEINSIEIPRSSSLLEDSPRRGKRKSIIPKRLSSRPNYPQITANSDTGTRAANEGADNGNDEDDGDGSKSAGRNAVVDVDTLAFVPTMKLGTRTRTHLLGSDRTVQPPINSNRVKSEPIVEPSTTKANNTNKKKTIDPIFRSDPYLSPLEMELLWLGEESMYALGGNEFHFDFIREHGSNTLCTDLAKLKRKWSEKEKINAIIRKDNPLVCLRFDTLRMTLRESFDRGYRRPQMRKVIATLRVERKKVECLRNINIPEDPDS